MAKIDRKNLDPGQLPDWAEFTKDGDNPTLVEPKEGFLLNAGDELRLGSWRVLCSASAIAFQYYNGASWVTKGSFSV